MIFDETCKKIIEVLTLKNEFEKAENMLSNFVSENELHQSIDYIFSKLLSTHDYSSAFSFIKKYFEGDKLTYYTLLIFNHKQKNPGPILTELQYCTNRILENKDNLRYSPKTHALMAEIFFNNNQLDSAQSQNDIALNIWKEESGEIMELAPIIYSLRIQNQIDKANSILDELKGIAGEVPDDISRRNFFYEINEIRQLLKESSSEEDVDDSWDEEKALLETPYHRDEVKSACLIFLSRQRNPEGSAQYRQNIIYQQEFLRNNLPDYFSHFDYYKSLKNDVLAKELISLRENLKSLDGYTDSSQNQNVVYYLDSLDQ